MSGDPEFVTFSQVLVALAEGARGARRRGWSDGDLFIYLNATGRAVLGHGPDAPVAADPRPEGLAVPVICADLSAIDMSDPTAVVKIPTISGWYRNAGFHGWIGRREDLTANDWYIV